MVFKHTVRDAWLTASYYTGLSRLYKSLAGQKRAIVSYHNVLPVSELLPYDTYNVDVTADVFEKQLVFLKKYFRVLPIHELHNPKAEGIFLTVDDGMRNNYEILAPIIEKHGLTALFAVCPAMIDGEIPHIWRDHLFLLLQKVDILNFKKALQIQGIPNFKNLEYLKGVKDTSNFKNLEYLNTLTRSFKKYIYENQIADIYGLVQEICQKNAWPYAPLNADPLRYQCMNWEQIEALSKRGHQIASHTMTHRVLRFLSEEEKKHELQESKKRMENRLNISIDILVYPYGSMAEIDEATVKMTNEIGYKMALMNVRQHTLSMPMLTQTRFAFPNITNEAHLYAIASGYKFLFR